MVQSPLSRILLSVTLATLVFAAILPGTDEAHGEGPECVAAPAASASRRHAAHAVS